ncbi:MAG TPA: OmpA family protein [Minicystis sp.]|nr:OmpA family protein [Minicystis sp.]
MRHGRVGAALFAVIAVAVMGCGHTEEEWQWQLDKLARAQGDLASTQGKLEQAVAACEADRRRAAELSAQAERGPALSATLQEREKAIAEHQARERYRAAAAAEAEALRAKLADLAASGVAVGTRRGRLTITVPGDLLFSPFRGDAITKPGGKALQKIAAAIKSDPQLVNATWAVSGHGDDKKLDGGVYRDALGVSLMHARAVVAELLAAGGFLAPRWSAAGYAGDDPVAPNDNDADRKKNRRVEITLVPPDASTQAAAPPGAAGPRVIVNPTGP